jgi:hypothetical protein
VNGGLGDNVGVEAVAEVNGVDVVAGTKLESVVLTRRQPRVAARMAEGAPWTRQRRGGGTYHSRSLYMIVKKTCRKRLTAFINTASRYSHASPVIVEALCAG